MPKPQSRPPFRQHRGFTLTELAIVMITSLIIISAALHYFDHLIRNTNRHMLLGVKGTIDSAVLLAHLNAQAQNVSSGNLMISSRNTPFLDGYPQARWDITFRYFVTTSNSSGVDPVDERCNRYPLCGVDSPSQIPGIGPISSGRVVMIWPSGYKLDERCFLYYHHPENGNPPSTGLILDGC